MQVHDLTEDTVMLEIRKASPEDLLDATKLFNLYRIFYKRDDNLKETEKFIEVGRNWT